MTNEWQSPAHTADYLEQRAHRVPYRAIAETTLVEELPARTRRVLDLGSGDGRLLQVVLDARPGAEGTALDFSPSMLDRLHARFDGRPDVRVVEHNLDDPLPALGRFDAVVSSFAIHHLEHARKRTLYGDIWDVLEPGGVFCNLEHVAAASASSHAFFMTAMGLGPDDEDPSNKLLELRTQLDWLREIGFADVDCYWRWRELALLVGRKGVGA
jgi:SAM-dependent methyltransferase